MCNLKIQLSFNNKTTNESEAYDAVTRKVNIVSTLSQSVAHYLTQR
jgi:hypothetical protein